MNIIDEIQNFANNQAIGHLANNQVSGRKTKNIKLNSSIIIISYLLLSFFAVLVGPNLLQSGWVVARILGLVLMVITIPVFQVLSIFDPITHILIEYISILLPSVLIIILVLILLKFKKATNKD